LGVGRWRALRGLGSQNQMKRCNKISLQVILTGSLTAKARDQGKRQVSWLVSLSSSFPSAVQTVDDLLSFRQAGMKAQ